MLYYMKGKGGRWSTLKLKEIIATSVQKGCKWENSNLRKTIFIVQPHKGNNPNILLQTVTTFEQAYVWCSNCSIIHGHLQPFPRNFSEVLTITKCT